jgi:hypothetical protein
MEQVIIHHPVTMALPTPVPITAQQLPSWMSFSSVSITDASGVETVVPTIVTLPLTYIGPSVSHFIATFPLAII